MAGRDAKSTSKRQAGESRLDQSLHADAEWNAGHLGCGPLVLDLRKRLRAMPGGVLKVIALDISAPHDIPAWCRLTQNDLLAHDPTTSSFWIRSRQAWS